MVYIRREEGLDNHIISSFCGAIDEPIAQYDYVEDTTIVN